jgi:hypothetical protein
MPAHTPFELLEPRQLFAVTQINFPDFSNTTNLVGNGFGSNALTSGNLLRLTRNVDHEARSVWFGTAVPITRFRSDFTFESEPSAISADGLTFTVQNGPTSALGGEGNNLGVGGIGNSEAVCFNMFNFASFGSKFGFASNGPTPPVTNTNMSPIDLHTGHKFLTTVTYDGTNLKVAVTDASDGSKTFNATMPIDLPSAIGSDTAIVGFTASTGDHISIQEIRSWDFQGSGAPTVATAASANPSPVTGKTTTLSVLGADDNGEGALTYTWSLVKKPSGAKDPTFSANGTNGAKSITARFFKDGSYRFRCTIENALGLKTTSDVVVRVDQTASLIRMDPHVATITLPNTQDYDALMIDQFNHEFRDQPDFTFSLPEGSGTIDATSGLYTPTAPGHAVIQAAASGLTGTVGATVVKST